MRITSSSFELVLGVGDGDSGDVSLPYDTGVHASVLPADLEHFSEAPLMMCL